MIQIEDMVTFIAVVECGGVTAAAQQLDTTKSVVSKRISDLEKKLGTHLLDRGSRSVRPTEVGAVYYAKCLRIVESIHAANDYVTGFNDLVAGRLRVVVSRMFLRSIFEEALNAFAAQYPDVLLQVETLSPNELSDRDFDIALQVGVPGGGDLIARPLFEFAYVMCASPEYLREHRLPESPGDLAGHAALIDSSGESADAWCYRAEGNWVRYRLRERLRSDSCQQLIAAARAGQGVAMVPELLIAEDLDAGRLCRLLPGYETPVAQLSLLYPRSRRASKKVQKLYAFLRDLNLSGRPED